MKLKKIFSWKTALIISAILLSFISVLAPSYQWATYPELMTAKTITFVTVFSLCLCKLAFYPLGLKLYLARQYFGAAMLITFSFILLGLSVAATNEFLQDGINKKSEQRIKNSIEFETLSQQLKSYNDQIKNKNVAIKIDSSSKYIKVRQRASEEQAKINNLENKRIETLASIKKLSVSKNKADTGWFNKNPAPTYYGSMEGLYSSSFLAAACLHLGTVLAVLALSVWLPLTETKKQSVLTIPEKPKTTPPQPKRGILDSVSEPKIKDKQKPFLENLLSGQYGIDLVVRELTSEAVGGFKAVKQVFSYLEYHGYIERIGKRYRLTEKARQGDLWKTN
ncbi:MAG: hypothetical protein K6L75_02405 [Cellvibrionaceae bacterium]